MNNIVYECEECRFKTDDKAFMMVHNCGEVV